MNSIYCAITTTFALRIDMAAGQWILLNELIEQTDASEFTISLTRYWRMLPDSCTIEGLDRRFEINCTVDEVKAVINSLVILESWSDSDRKFIIQVHRLFNSILRSIPVESPRVIEVE